MATVILPISREGEKVETQDFDTNKKKQVHVSHVMELLAIVLQITQAIKIHEFCCLFYQRCFSKSKSQYLLSMYCTIAFDIISVQPPPKWDCKIFMKKIWTLT